MTKFLHDMPDGGKHALDGLAGLATLGALAKVLPPVAAFFSIIWLAMQIFDRIKYGPRQSRG